MLVKVAILLLIAWLIGVAGLFDMGPAVHALLLAGMFLLLLALVRSRDAADGGASTKTTRQ